MVIVKSLSCVQLFATPCNVAYQAPPSMGFSSRQEYWSGLPFPSSGDLSNPGIKPGPPTLEADALTSEPPGKPILFLTCLLVYSKCEYGLGYDIRNIRVRFCLVLVYCLYHSSVFDESVIFLWIHSEHDQFRSEGR